MTKKRYIPASQIEQREIEWTMTRFIPKRQVCLIVGKRGEGKSTFAAWLTAALTTGEYPDHEGTMRQHEPQNVYFNAREDPLQRSRSAGCARRRRTRTASCSKRTCGS